MKHEIQIGEVLDLKTNEVSPALRKEISEETAEVLKGLCDMERDELGEEIYVLNKIRMKIVPLVLPDEE